MSSNVIRSHHEIADKLLTWC